MLGLAGGGMIGFASAVIASTGGGVAGALALAAGTFVSEDLACVSAGLMIHSRAIDPWTGVLACFAGIYTGDLGLWGLGRALRGGLARSPRLHGWVSRRVPPETLDRSRAWLDAHAARTLLLARVIPGMRLPVYVAAGVLGQRAPRFALWAAVAALFWTPLLVLGSAFAGAGAAPPLAALFGGGAFGNAAALATILGAAIVLGFGTRRLASADGRAAFAARLSRLWRWEFWPAWIFYAPLVPWIAWLALRHRGLGTIAAANPGIEPDGGFVGESKARILERLPAGSVVPGFLVGTGPAGARLEALLGGMKARGIAFPIVLKPDAGQRGAGMRFVSSAAEAGAYLRGFAPAVLAQAWHPGPHEAGIFYYSLPGAPPGRIFSITDKRFPEIVGDGTATLERLIWRDRRLRMQARTFLQRHAAARGRVLARGERLVLARAGNHCQGTMFKDGRHLLTPELERAIDAVARAFPGFHFGRFDVRYSDPEELRAGRGFAVVELNGVTSESTDIYDPDRSLFRAWRILFRQWALLFRIGALNRLRAGRAPGAGLLLRSVLRFYGGPRPQPLSD